MTRDDHIAYHKMLHAALDTLLADYTTHTGRLPSKTTTLDLLEWSYQQTLMPAAKPGEEE